MAWDRAGFRVSRAGLRSARQVLTWTFFVDIERWILQPCSREHRSIRVTVRPDPNPKFHPKFPNPKFPNPKFPNPKFPSSDLVPVQQSGVKSRSG